MFLQRALLGHGVRQSSLVKNLPFLSNHHLREISVDVDVNYSPSKRKSQRQKRSSGRSSYRFVDRTRVRVAGGAGGKGSHSMHKISRGFKRRPDGGHGGHGGSIVIVADPNEQSLRWTNPHVVAQSGANGSSQEKRGRNGKNKVLRVPLGVIVRRVLDFDEEWDEETKTVKKIYHPEDEVDEDGEFESENYQDEDGYDDDDYGHDSADGDRYEDETYEANQHIAQTYDDYIEEQSFTPWGEREKVVIADLDKAGSYVVVARGGRGGVGSSIFSSRNGPLPEIKVIADAAKATEVETAYLELELKLIADIGLVGFPNAGKSSLLAATSRATPHIAPYPFTTLNPLVGYIEYKDGFRVCAADVPGLIAGASEGRGKGHDFLRHLERTKALLYIVDAAGVDGRDPINDFEILVDELSAYGDGDMLKRRCLVVANKMDLLEERKRQGLIHRLNKAVEDAGIKMQGDIHHISAGVTGEGLASLSKAIRSTVIMSEADKDQLEQSDQRFQLP